MEPYEPPEKTIKVVRTTEPKVNFLSQKKNRIYLAAGLLFFIVTACVIGILFAANSPASNATESTTTSSLEAASSDALSGRVIVVDAGHGGFDPGAIGADGTQEDMLNLEVAKHLKDNLESYSAQVIMTRSDANAIAGTKDEDMAERRRIISESQSDIVVSVHMNSFDDGSVSGPLVLYMEGSSRGEMLAKSIQNSMIQVLNPDNENSARSDDLYILRSGNQPCVIVECGYLSNEQELQHLKSEDYQQKVADAICQGVIEYFSSDVK